MTLNAGISTQTVTIPILDNLAVAESMFSVVLTSADPAVVLHPETADVTIEDDDCELSSSQSVLGVQNFTIKLFLHSDTFVFGLNPANNSVAGGAGSINVTHNHSVILKQE